MTELLPESTVFNILVVDDVPDFHAVINMSLQNETVFGIPVNIVSAFSKQEALKTITEYDGEFALIFLDVFMESASAGFEFLAELRSFKLPTQPQVALITGQADFNYELEAVRKHEINAYVVKNDLTPSRLSSLLNTSIRNFLTIKNLESTKKKLQSAQIQQQDTNAYIRRIIDSLSDGLIVINQQGLIVSCNNTVSEMFGYNETELLHERIEKLMPAELAKNIQSDLAALNKSDANNSQSIHRELVGIASDGRAIPVEINVSTMISQGETLLIVLVRNISKRIETQKEMYRLAYSDKVTNLPNLTSFYNDLANSLNEPSHLMAFALVDLSGFYRINQAFGHDVGDQLLTLLVDRMSWALPTNTVLHRAVGTDFLIRLKSDKSAALDIVNEFKSIVRNLLMTIQQDITIGPSTHQISANIGIMVRNSNDIEQSKILHQLEFTAQQAKKIKHDQISVYNSSLEQADTNKFFLEHELSKAIDRGELSIQLQPQFNKKKFIVCSEALIRWNSSTLGFIPPDKFIPVAEESGLIIKIGRWVLESVCSLIANTRKLGYKTNIAINLSARELLQPDFVEYVVSTVQQYQIPANALTIEITESVFATDIESVIANMNELADFGVRFSIDDFGTGYSSLSYLKRLPINELKIDKSFVDDITDPDIVVPLVDAIITMAKSFDLDIVAEGVEEECQFDYLMMEDSLIIQGYLFSRPLAIDDWYKLINKK